MSPAQTALGTLQGNYEPSLLERRDSGGTVHVELRGYWILRSIRTRTVELLRLLAQASSTHTHWDLTHLDDLDFAAATLLWRSWQRQRPPHLALKPADEHLFEQLENLSSEEVPAPLAFASPLFGLTSLIRSFAVHARGMLEMLGEIAIWSVRLARSPAVARHGRRD